MDFTFVLFAAAFIGILLAAAMGLRLLLPLVAQHFMGGGGGWRALAAGYATTRPAPAKVFTRQHVVVAQVLYRNSMVVGVDDEGLYLALGFPLSLLGRPPVFVPWRDFKRVAEARLFWGKAALLTVGAPPVTTITVPMALFAAMRPALTAATTLEGLREMA